jgi:hypothetical protein
MNERGPRLAERIARLHSVDLSVDGGVHRFDEALADVLALNDADAFGPLASMFTKEDSGFEEAMWSLLHALEHLGSGPDPSDYSRRLLAVLPALSCTAPKWATTLLLRVLNSDTDSAAMRALLKSESATAIEIDTVRSLSERIQNTSPDLRERVRRLGLSSRIS